MPTDIPENKLVRINVEGYEETNRISTRFFDCNGTTFDIPNEHVHNLLRYFDEQDSYILISRGRAERLMRQKQVDFEEYEE